MYATKPKGINLKEWADKTNFATLPERVRKKRRKKKDKNNLDFKKVISYAEIFQIQVMSSQKYG
jgi:hypothetical protein